MKRQSVILLVLSLLLLGAEGARLLWYHAGKPPWTGDPILRFVPGEGAERDDLEGSRASEILSYDAATAVRRRGVHHPSWSMDVIFLEYREGNQRLWTDLFTHSPEICFRNSGAQLLETFPSRAARIDGRELTFRHLLFGHPLSAQPVHVFKMIWLPRMEDLGIRGDENDYRKGRLAAARARHDPPGALTLVTVAGVESPDAAWRLVAEHVVNGYRFVPPQD